MEKLYKFSIIVPCYNVESRVNKLFEMLCVKIKSKYEVIFIDDFSKDSTFEMLVEKQRYYDNVCAFKTLENGGPGLARNLGLEYARGEYILFCDSDDEFDISYLEKIEEYLKVLNNPDLLVFPYEVVRGKKCEKVDCYKKNSHMGKITANDFVCGMAGPVAKVYKAEIIKRENILFPARMLGEDFCFIVNYAIFIKSAYKIDEVFYKYIMNNESVTHKNKSKAEIRESTFQILQPLFSKYFPDIEIKMFANDHLLETVKLMCANSYTCCQIKEWLSNENKKYPKWIQYVDYDDQSLYRKIVYKAMYYNWPVAIKSIMYIRRILY